ncbi:acetyl-CoA carboxylase biotin carboxyl carrier protein [Glutamicibacter sp. X7]
MTGNQPDMRELKAIVDWANLAPDVGELTLKVGEVELHISRNNGAVPQGVASAPAAPLAPPVHEPSAASTPAPAAPAARPESAAAPRVSADPSQLAEDEVLITAPMLGTFYAAPQPGAAAFVSVGDSVQPHSVLGIVEVMKLMNNIEAGVAGSVVRILAKNESLVEYGQPLMVIKRDAS